MHKTFKKVIKDSLNGYMLPFHSDKIAEKVTMGLIAAGAIIPVKGNEKS